MKVVPFSQSFVLAENFSKDPKRVATEFEAILIELVLKEAYRPLLRGKGFYQRLYYDMFLESVSRELAKSGGVGVAKFIVERYGWDRRGEEREDKGSSGALRGEVSQEDIHGEGGELLYITA